MDDADAVQRSAATGATVAGAWSHPFGEVFATAGSIETVLAASLRPGAKELEQLAAMQRRLAAIEGHGLLGLREITIDAQGRLVLRCEGFDGEPLHRLVARARPSAARVLAILHGIARALTAAHDGGVLHRALSPAAVLVGRDDEVRVLDFGLGMLLRQDSPALDLRLDPITPERVLGLPPSASDDIYAFGCLGYLLATGEPPLVDDDAARLRRRHAIEDPPRLSRRPDLAIDRAFAKLLDRCLAKDPEDRPASMSAVREALPPLPIASKPAAAPAKPAITTAVASTPTAPKLATTPKPATTPAPPKLATTPKPATTPAPPKLATTPAPPKLATTPKPPTPKPATTPAPPKLATAPKPATPKAAPSPEIAAAPEPPPIPEVAAAPEPPPIPEVAAAPEPPPIAIAAPAVHVADLGAPPDPAFPSGPPRATPATDRVVAAPSGSIAPRSPWWQRADVRIGAAAVLLLGVLGATWSVARGPDDDATRGASSALAVAADTRTVTAASTASVPPSTRAERPADEHDLAEPIARPSTAPDGAPIEGGERSPIDAAATAPTEAADAVLDEPLAEADPPVDAALAPGTPTRVAELLAGAREARRAGRRAEATHAFKEVAELDPDNLQALEALTRLAFDRGDFTQAVRWGKRAVAAAPGSARNRIALGDAYFKLGKRTDAKAQYEKADRLGHALAKRRLAMLGG